MKPHRDFTWKLTVILSFYLRDWNFYRGPQPEEDRFTPQNIYNEPLQPQNPITNFRSKNQHQTYMGSAQPESYGYAPDPSVRKPLISSEYSLNKPQSPFYGEESETRGPDFSIPPLPSLENEKIDEIAEKSNDTTAGAQPSEPEEPELQEEPTDEILGRIDQDPYEAQLRALNAIEACRLEQTALLQNLFDTEQGGNQTEGLGMNKTDRVLVPGSLLDCVHKSVQQRCRSSAGTSSLTGRYACEAVCAIVRERMPQLAGKIDDCRQPLTSCTERFVAFQVASRWIDPAYVSPTDSESDQIKANQNNLPKDYVASGEYCQECGTRRWHLKPIRGTNLFFLVDYAISGASSLSCKCNCKKRFCELDPTKPRPIRLRRDPPSPEVCTIIKASLENSTVCTDDGKAIQPSWVLLLIVATIQLLK
ncbi:hypothetical protein CRM22_005588 [Opisthorchis felineus]|uniref:Uncharacterized protein n=1 Tax=Opisthorchis felineus TaxID=147828 RepID=A0A4S2LXP7_OPIFE|nr:hypothetical protein CRM22_005588 [Opisthorchis felineus]